MKYKCPVCKEVCTQPRCEWCGPFNAKENEWRGGATGPVHVAEPLSGAEILDRLGIDKEGNEV